MPDTQTDFTALVASRICHDLISPIGAIGNGLELLELTRDTNGPEMALISDSVGNANARIRFFRIAFGVSGAGQSLAHVEIDKTVQDYVHGGRISVTWHPDQPISRTTLKVIFLSILCVENALAYGGKIDVRFDNHVWSISTQAARLSLVPEVWQPLQNGTLIEDITPSQLEFSLLPKIAREAEIGVVTTTETDRVTIEITGAP